MTVVLVTGGREFANVPFLWEALDCIDNALSEPGITCIVEGASDEVAGRYCGADYWARQWAFCRGRAQRSMPAKWDSHGKAAGPIRNAEMLERFKPGLVVAFKGGRGTADMMSKASRANIPLLDLTGDDWKMAHACGLANQLIRGALGELTTAPDEGDG